MEARVPRLLVWDRMLHAIRLRALPGQHGRLARSHGWCGRLARALVQHGSGVGLGAGVKGLGFRVSGFWFLVSGLGFRVSGFGFQISGVEVRVSVSGFGLGVLAFSNSPAP